MSMIGYESNQIIGKGQVCMRLTESTTCLAKFSRGSLKNFFTEKSPKKTRGLMPP